MARIKFGDLFGSYDIVALHFSLNFSLEASGPRHAVYRDTGEHGSIVFGGRGLKYDGEAMVAGTVESISFMNSDDGAYMTIVGDFKATQAFAELDARGADGIYWLALKGNDTVVGSVKKDFLHGSDGRDTLLGGIGDDWLDGGVGNDELRGGKGSNLFIFGPGRGRDVIIDFDASGGEGSQDFLHYFGEIEGFEKHRDGRNTVLEFDGGGRLTVLDVRPGQITDADFSTPG